MHDIYAHSSKQCIHNFLSSKSERRGCCISNERAKSHINGNRQKQRCGSGRIKGCVIEFSGGESSSLFRLELYQGGERSPSLLWMRERAAWRPSLRGTSPMNYSQIGKASYRLLSIPPFCHLSLLFSPCLCAAFFVISSFHYFHLCHRCCIVYYDCEPPTHALWIFILSLPSNNTLCCPDH